MIVADARQRGAALNPRRSFCVAAPAGSGKTELLIQRYLVLLARVARPEQVLAITFTRKAAAEMRERVIGALEATRTSLPVESEHDKVTRDLAAAVLGADNERGWHLMRDLSRFNIKTIDSFCAGLSRQMPVLSGLGGRAGGQDDVAEYYEEAVLELFRHLDDDGPAAEDLKAVMRRFDNNWERLQERLVAMLYSREQWRDYISVNRDPEASEAYLVEAMAAVVQGELDALAVLLEPHEGELLALSRYVAGNLEQAEPAAFPRASLEDINSWRALRDMFLTKAGSWRAKVDKRDGFPGNSAEDKDWKDRWQAQREALKTLNGLQGKLATVAILPLVEAGSDNWQLVLHLSRLLPLLAAELLLVFQRHGVVDHAQVAQSALLALGEDEAVTDLALRLDYSIEHILVDEFQDTAVTQYDLLHKLTRGWQEHNAVNPDTPRTLMIVGDPMQSIYRFRGANVGLFLVAREQGFNGIRPEYLQLQCNFRSERGIVEWVNQAFVEAFPDRDNAHLSQVRYSPALAVRDAGSARAVDAHGFHGEGAAEAEVGFVCDYIGAHACEEETVAVLGRTRGHLQPIIDELKRRGIAHNAQDLDSLAASPVVADLLLLCRALSSDADRLAWMALLRAPWCGLSLADLLVVAGHGEYSPYTPVWQSLVDARCRKRLSEDGRRRLGHILPALARARARRDRLGLRVLVEQAWTGMGGPDCVAQGGGLVDAEQFMQLLEQAEATGTALDTDWLHTRLENQFMSGDEPDAPVQLMTLHKAKGLEFPRVVIPQLGRQPRANDRDLLRWEEHADARGRRHFLLAADDGSKSGEASLYNYLGHLHREKELLETTRLLYVGATRAARHLLLTTRLSWDEKNDAPAEPATRSLLSPIWPAFARQMCVHHPGQANYSAAGFEQPRLLGRLEREAPPPPLTLPNTAASAAKNPGTAGNHRERSIGTVVHLALEKLSLRVPLPETIAGNDKTLWRLALQAQGLFGDQLGLALAEVATSVETTLGSREGRWVLSSEHPGAYSEWALCTVDEEGDVQDIVIDRTFVDSRSGCRWIVDYKNSSPMRGERRQDFVSRESEAYREQLRRYRNALRHVCTEPLRCALFFTTQGIFHPLSELDLPGR